MLFLVGVVVYLALPSSYYLRRALIYQKPRIDHHEIFKSRLVEAKAPSPWLMSPNFNEQDIPSHLIPKFEEYETVAFLVIKDSAILFEQYWENYSPQSLSNSFSMAKSIISLAIGCAIDDGYIKDVNQSASDFVPNFPSFNGKTLTIRHLLTMSAGVDFQEEYTSLFSPTTKLYYGDHLEKIVFGMKQIEEPGVNFVYQSGVTQLLAFILEKATGERLSSYVSRKLWTPMQAEENALWSLDKMEGIEKAFCCFNSNIRDFARFGQLLLNNGAWNGQQLVSPAYIEEAIHPDATLLYKEYNEPNRHYGYQFWRLRYNELEIPYMRGILGQYVFVIPEYNAAIVRLGHKRSDTRTDQHYPSDIDVWLEAGLSIIQANN